MKPLTTEIWIPRRAGLHFFAQWNTNCVHKLQGEHCQMQKVLSFYSYMLHFYDLESFFS